MKKNIVRTFVALLAVAIVALSPAITLATPADQIKGGVSAAGGDNSGGSLEDNLGTIVNILLYILGAIAVIMIVIGGIRYATSNGDSSAITSAKNTILYSVIGLIVAIMAYAIVNFVVGSFK
jgi:hypothetical protein